MTGTSSAWPSARHWPMELWSGRRAPLKTTSRWSACSLALGPKGFRPRRALQRPRSLIGSSDTQLAVLGHLACALDTGIGHAPNSPSGVVGNEERAVLGHCKGCGAAPNLCAALSGSPEASYEV